jgi:hypothetical protein
MVTAWHLSGLENTRRRIGRFPYRTAVAIIDGNRTVVAGAAFRPSSAKTRPIG